MRKILIIEDDTAHAEMYKIAFSKSGFEVGIAFDGEAGLVKSRIERPDIILLDILMPRVSGLQVLEELKTRPETKDIPVVVMTNLTEMDIEKTAMKMGAYLCLAKHEYVPSEIVKTIEKLLDAANPEGSSAPSTPPSTPPQENPPQTQN